MDGKENALLCTAQHIGAPETCIGESCPLDDPECPFKGIKESESAPLVAGVRMQRKSGRPPRWIHIDVHIETNAIFVQGNRWPDESEEKRILDMLVSHDYLEYAPEPDFDDSPSMDDPQRGE